MCHKRVIFSMMPGLLSTLFTCLEHYSLLPTLMQWGSDFWWLDCLFPDKAFSDSRQEEPLAVFSPLASHASLSISCSFLYTFCITPSWILSTQHSNWVQKYCCYSPLDFMNEWHIEHICSIAFVNTTLLQCVLRQIYYRCYCCQNDSFVPCFAKKKSICTLKNTLPVVYMSGIFQNNLHVFLLELLFKNKQNIEQSSLSYIQYDLFRYHFKYNECPCPSQILMLCGSQDRRGVWGRMDTCIRMAESFCCPPEIITTLLISYSPKSFLASLHSFSWFFSWSQPLSKFVRWLEEHLGLFSGSIIRQGLQTHFCGSLATEVLQESGARVFMEFSIDGWCLLSLLGHQWLPLNDNKNAFLWLNINLVPESHRCLENSAYICRLTWGWEWILVHGWTLRD